MRWLTLSISTIWKPDIDVATTILALSYSAVLLHLRTGLLILEFFLCDTWPPTKAAVDIAVRCMYLAAGLGVGNSHVKFFDKSLYFVFLQMNY